METSYADRFQDQSAVESYDSQEYGSGSYSSAVWQLQRPVLQQILRDFRLAHQPPVRLLDFACGTGRVLSSLEPLVDYAEGVDISENMVAVARTRCRTVDLRVTDILSDPAFPGKRYDVISCFRFLLNVEPALRSRVLRRLRGVLRDPGGLLLVNVHGNSRSLRHPSIAWHRRRGHIEGSPSHSGLMLNEMSPGSTRDLLRESGFRVVRQYGFGLAPPGLYRLSRTAASLIDRVTAGDRWWKDWAVDMLFVCEPL